MANLPLLLYLILFLAAAFAPLRWSIIAFLLLSNIDLGSFSTSIGLLNTAKAMILPVYMLWRFRAYAGHGKITAAPIAWSLLIVYVAIASSWSLFPMFAIKLVGHMLSSLVICLMLLRASKGGYLTPRTVLPVAFGAIGMATVHWFFLHDWGGETERFTTFSAAQAFAAFITALYCTVLCTRSIQLAWRIPMTLLLALTVLLDGSRIWILGLLAATLTAVFVSGAKPWVKVVTLGVTLVLATTIAGELDAIMTVMEQHASSNRIAAAVTAVYEGNFKSRGLGTYNLRNELFRRTMDSVEQSSPLQLVFGHGTCNGAVIAATLNRNPDPNRAMHDEWLRVIYEWGITGLILWSIFILSLVVYAAKGVRRDRMGHAKPLLIYLPAFALGLTGENIIAGAGNAVSVGLLMLIAFASMSHRQVRAFTFVRSSDRRSSLTDSVLNRARQEAAYRPLRGPENAAG